MWEKGVLSVSVQNAVIATTGPWKISEVEVLAMPTGMTGKQSSFL